MTEYYIYKISCNDPNITDCYIGSTKSFIKRQYEHKHSSNNEKDQKYNQYKYEFIRNNGGWNNWIMSIIETFVTDNKDVISNKEQNWINILKPTLNTRYANGLNLPKIINQRKNYYQKNKDIIIKKQLDKYYKKKELQTITISDIQ